MTTLRRSDRLKQELDKKYLVQVRDVYKNVSKLIFRIDNSHPGFNCDLLEKIYKLMTANFALITTYDNMIGAPRLWHMMYNKSFDYLSQVYVAIQKKSPKVHPFHMTKLKKVFFGYRKKYEEFRMREWALKQWRVYLPVEMLNIISSYLFGS